MKEPIEWISEIGEVVSMAMFGGGNPPGTKVEDLVARIQADAREGISPEPDTARAFEDWWRIYGTRHYSPENKPFCVKIFIWGFSAGKDAAQQAYKIIHGDPDAPKERFGIIHANIKTKKQ